MAPGQASSLSDIVRHMEMRARPSDGHTDQWRKRKKWHIRKEPLARCGVIMRSRPRRSRQPPHAGPVSGRVRETTSATLAADVCSPVHEAASRGEGKDSSCQQIMPTLLEYDGCTRSFRHVRWMMAEESVWYRSGLVHCGG